MPNATTLDGLREVRRLLAEPEAWTQHAPSRDAAGEWEGPYSANASCWCLTGAVEVVRRRTGAAEEPMIYALVKQLPPRPRYRNEWMWIATWQDAPHRTHAEVLALIDAAISAEGGA